MHHSIPDGETGCTSDRRAGRVAPKSDVDMMWPREADRIEPDPANCLESACAVSSHLHEEAYG